MNELVGKSIKPLLIAGLAVASSVVAYKQNISVDSIKEMISEKLGRYSKNTLTTYGGYMDKMLHLKDGIACYEDSLPDNSSIIFHANNYANVSLKLYIFDDKGVTIQAWDVPSNGHITSTFLTKKSTSYRFEIIGPGSACGAIYISADRG